MEGGHREDPQPSQRGLGGPAGHSQEALGVWLLTPLQAGQVTPESEQVQVQFLQVLLPLLDLRINTANIFSVLSSNRADEVLNGPDLPSDLVLHSPAVLLLLDD